MQKWKVPENFGHEVSIGGATFPVVEDEEHGRLIVIESEGDYSSLTSFGCSLVEHVVEDTGELEDWLKVGQEEPATEEKTEESDEDKADDSETDETKDDEETSEEEASGDDEESGDDESEDDVVDETMTPAQKKAARRAARKNKG